MPHYTVIRKPIHGEDHFVELELNPNEQELSNNIKSYDHLYLFESLEDAQKVSNLFFNEYTKNSPSGYYGLIAKVSTKKILPAKINISADNVHRELIHYYPSTSSCVSKDMIECIKAEPKYIKSILKTTIPSEAQSLNANLVSTDFTRTMRKSFFRALNPLSKKSGIIHIQQNKHHLNQHAEIEDVPISSRIVSAFKSNGNYLEALQATYEIIVGNHYESCLMINKYNKNPSKGVLDFLIFPLVARKLIADTYLDEKRNDHIENALAWMVAIPLELARFSAAVALTILLAPVVLITHLIKSCMPNNEENISIGKDMSLI